MERTEVLVVGGGPAGMTVAGDLARAGRSVTVLERWPQANPASRAFATMARTLEALDSRGLADDLLADSFQAAQVDLFGAARLDLSRVDSQYRFAMITPQTRVDRALSEYAARQGADVHRGVEVVDLTQDADGVSVTARPKGGGEETTWRASYVVGADGAHSTVRDLVGEAFPGKSVLRSVVLADVRLDHGPAGRGLHIGSTPNAFGFLVSYGHDDWFRTLLWDRRRDVPEDTPITTDEVAALLAGTLGPDLGLRAVGWHSRFHSDERQVEHYRVGRVFLVGDAAHVHSPVGGQGMNTGIQDAANLGWKLAAVLGGADDAVLDTYQTERHPIGRRVILQSGLMLRAVILHPRPARWLRNLVAPLVLRTPALAGPIAGSFMGTSLRYGRRGLVGTRAVRVPLVEGRMTELQRDGGFLRVVPAGAAEAADVRTVHRTDAGPALLVRPDGYVAWAGDAEDHGWREVLVRWTGQTPQVQSSRSTATSAS